MREFDSTCIYICIQTGNFLFVERIGIKTGISTIHVYRQLLNQCEFENMRGKIVTINKIGKGAFLMLY